MTQINQKLVHHFLENSANSFPNKIAFIQDESRVTYKEIDNLANSIANWLISNGIKKGDRVVMILNNGLEYILSYYGIMKAGGIAVSLSTAIKPDGLKPLLDELEPTAIISSTRFENIMKETSFPSSLKNILIKDPKLNWSSSQTVVSWDDVISSNDSPFPNILISESDIASIIYTSGSTGEPKGVILTHSNLTTNTASICEYLKLTNEDIQMVVLPFFYVMGKSLLNTHFAVGGTVVINNKFAFTASVVKQMAEEKVTGFSGVPSTYAYLLHRSPLSSYRDKLPFLRYCSQAGGHMSKQIKQELRHVLPEYTDIVIMYGATEASARLTYLEPEKFEEKIDSIGRSIPGVTMKIIDENNEEVPVGKTGELVGSGKNIMQGYWKDKELSSKVLDSNGYHTGDLGYSDEEGYLYLVGRKDNLLKVGGHRINPQEVEDALMATGLIVETTVIGMPDELLGNKLVAVAVVIDKESTDTQILDSCAEKLPKYKLPRKIKLVRALPKKPNGKIDRTGCENLVT